MKTNVIPTGLLAFAVITSTSLSAFGGVILISTRYQQDTQFATEFVSDEKGPGMVTPGDVAMGSLLADHGYSVRIVLDRLLGPAAANIGHDPAEFLIPQNPDMSPMLAIMSGSGASADTPPPPDGVPVMMGEHVCLGNNSARMGSLYMYNGTSSSDPNESSTPPATKYMKVVAPDHPIMKGIPTDAQGRVKIFRDPYPEEDAHIAPGGKKNYEYRWCTQAVADAAPGTTILGVLDNDESRSCFAVVDVGGILANEQPASVRLVHMFTNEQGSGGSRRVFLALTEIGRVLFVRAAKWAMGEELQPFKSFKILDITPQGAQAIKLSWEGSPQHNYRIQASDDLTTWSTVIEDVAGRDGVASRTLDISAAPSTLFLRVAAVP
ncbi:MAG: hypothetical protein GX456_12080 [Verrucomicrobia bacterium]|nr:hypothetical protein [Verrucomicrobiota bacterium]